jgi:hypothetical protein
LLSNAQLVDTGDNQAWPWSSLHAIKKIAKREGRVNLPSTWRPAGVSDAPLMSRHNQKRSVEEDRSLFGGAHAMKSVKPSAYIPEGLSTEVQVCVSAPYLIHKWFHLSQSPSF